MSARVEEYRHKVGIVHSFMSRHGLDAVILTRRCNFAWLTAGGLNHVGTAVEAGAASLLVTAEGTECITSNIESPRVHAEELSELGIRVRAYPWFDSLEPARVWEEALGRRTAACDARVAGLPSSVKNLDASFNSLRWSLRSWEMDRYRQLGREVAETLESCCRQARPGMAEHELAARISEQLLARAIRTPTLLIAADERVRLYRHPIPTAKQFVQYGMAVCGAERGGLIVSASRLFSFGRPSDELLRRHRAVCQVDAAMMAATRPGKTLGSVLAIAKKTYADGGYPDEWQHHHQGGLTGYVGREIRATPGNATEIKAHQAFAWNPSIAGTKSEDTLLVGTDGNEIISATGSWPTTSFYAGTKSWPRCDILAV